MVNVIKSQKVEMDQPGYAQCTFLNDSFSFDKVCTSVCNLSNKKAVGIADEQNGFRKDRSCKDHV